MIRAYIGPLRPFACYFTNNLPTMHNPTIPEVTQMGSAICIGRTVLLLLALLLYASMARAGLVCRSGGNGVVMRVGKASEYFSLIRNKEIAEAAKCCVACIIDSGTKVIITDQGFASHTIRVLEGPDKGCVGDLPAEYVKDCN